MRISLIPSTVALALIFNAGGVAAQRLEQAGAGSFEIRMPVLPIDQVPIGPPTLRNRILTGLAAAVLGAGVGYFASQVATGSWEEGSGQGGVHRPTWAALGGAGGLVLGLSFPIGRGGPGQGTPFPQPGGRFSISGDDVRKAGVGNALEAVRFFHPEWLVLRGKESSFGPDMDHIRAYVDNVVIGDVGALVQVDIGLIEFIRFFDSRQATARWGMSHPQGAIQVVTLGRGSSR
jgi:hypothetical protein